MSKTSLKKVETPAEIISKQQRKLKAGKAGYKGSDAQLDKLESLIESGVLSLGEWIKLPSGDEGRVIDQFAESNKVGYGGATRRYKVEVRGPDGVLKKA